MRQGGLTFQSICLPPRSYFDDCRRSSPLQRSAGFEPTITLPIAHRAGAIIQACAIAASLNAQPVRTNISRVTICRLKAICLYDARCRARMPPERVIAPAMPGCATNYEPPMITCHRAHSSSRVMSAQLRLPTPSRRTPAAVEATHYRAEGAIRPPPANALSGLSASFSSRSASAGLL